MNNLSIISLSLRLVKINSHHFRILHLISGTLRRWFQIVLSTISAVILTFANTVRRAGSSQSLWASGFSFSAIGVIIAFVNCFCTFSCTRLSRRISGNKIEVKKIFPTLKRYCKTSVIISLVGLFVSLIGKIKCV
jgi:Protein of unknown function (DUF3611)